MMSHSLMYQSGGSNRMAREPLMRRAEPLLTVIIPVYNEAATIAETLDAVSRSPLSKQIIVVDDGSTDDSLKAVGGWMCGPGAACGVRLCRHAANRGKGAAIRTGLVYAEGQIVIVQDADLECDPSDYPALVTPILDGSAEVVLGSRFLAAGVPRPWNAGRCFVAFANGLVRILYGRRISDEAGCYKVMRTRLLRDLDLRCKRFEFCPEVVAKACMMGLVIREVPVRYRPRTRREGKKIGWRDAAQAMFTLFWWRFAGLSESVRSAHARGRDGAVG
jgi:glycosyltransferase involved in cell wall biosynthesis